MAVAPCTRVKWRGVVVCSHTVPKLNAWAKSVGQGILLTPLAGCGSYQTTTKASAGTHAGGGAIDIDLRSVASTKRKWVADLGRTAGLQVAWHRNAITGLWTWHCHALDPACPNLASAAASQCVECFNGGDGLVGSTRDANTRVNIPALKTAFANRFSAAVGDIADTIGKIGATVSDQARVTALLKAVRQAQTTYWDADADIDLRNTRAEATDRSYGGQFFNDRRWNLGQRTRMQRSWGCKVIDGKWGPQTAAACKATVVAIQRGLGVTADGVWGPVTDKAYTALGAKYRRPWYINRPTGAFPTPGTRGSMYGPSTANKPWYSGKVGGTLSVSTIRWQIKRIQRMVGATADGLYGAQTVTKVKAWQKAHRLTVDGVTGPGTWDAMRKANNA